MRVLGMERISIATIMVAVFFGLPGLAGTQPEPRDRDVMRFFPEELKETGEERLYAYANADFAGTGEADYIVAAFSNGFGGAVRVLRVRESTVAMVSAPSFQYMGGIFPTVKTQDVDADGRPEAIIGFSTGSGIGAATWVMKWNGTTLESIGPGARDENGQSAGTELNGPLFIDFDGDKRLEIIAPDDDAPLGDHNESLWLALYHLSGAHYEKTGTIDFFETFTRGKGAPIEQVREFTVANVSKAYVMTVIDRSDKLVSNAEIWLNGKAIVRPKTLKDKTRVTKTSVVITQNNTLMVRLVSGPGTAVSIGIGPE